MIENIKKELLEKTNNEAKSIYLGVYPEGIIRIKEDSDGSINIIIDTTYYNEHKEEIDNLLLEFIRKYSKDTITISSPQLINDNLVIALCANDNIKDISLARSSILYKYYLTKKHYDLFKQANKEKIRTRYVDEELEENYDPMIAYNYEKKLYSYHSYEDYQGKTISFYSEIPEKDLYTLKYLGENTEVIISTNCNIKDIIETLKKYNKNNKVTITIYNKEKLNAELMNLGCFDNNEEYPNIFLKPLALNINATTLSEYLKYERLLYSMIEPAKDLSPFEKLIYAYDITKKFKKYKTPKKDNKNIVNLPDDEYIRIKSESRDLYRILENDYIVCVGYANLLGDLLTKLGIDNIPQSVEVDLAYHKSGKQLSKSNPDWKNKTPEEKFILLENQTINIPKTDYEGHRRVMIHLKDDKYGINGIYFSDPTWDNDYNKNSYAHMIMTEEDVSRSMSTVKINNEYLLFSATSIDEFYLMINKILDNKKRDRLKNYKIVEEELGEKPTKEEIMSDDKADFCVLFRLFFQKIRKLLSKEYNELTKEYPFLEKDYIDIESIDNPPKEFLDALYEIGKIIVMKNNNSISDETLKTAAMEVYKNIYEGGLKERELNKMMEDTDLYRTLAFAPKNVK